MRDTCAVINVFRIFPSLGANFTFSACSELLVSEPLQLLTIHSKGSPLQKAGYSRVQKQKQEMDSSVSPESQRILQESFSVKDSPLM